MRCCHYVNLLAASGLLAASTRAVAGPNSRQPPLSAFVAKQAFHDRFRDHAMRIMKKYDFNIISMWEARNGARTEFVYLLEWPDEATMKERWSKFMTDQEWKDIKKETAAKYGNLVGEVQDRTLHLTPYSPQKQLSR